MQLFTQVILVALAAIMVSSATATSTKGYVGSDSLVYNDAAFTDICCDPTVYRGLLTDNQCAIQDTKCLNYTPPAPKPTYSKPEPKPAKKVSYGGDDSDNDDDSYSKKSSHSGKSDDNDDDDDSYSKKSSGSSKGASYGGSS